MNNGQKIIKYAGIALAICLIVGIFTGICQAVGLIGGVVVNNHGDGLNINSYSDEAKILSINIGASNLKILEGNELKIESDNKYITSEQKFNKLAVKEKRHSNFGKSIKDEVTVYIPKDMIFDKVYISNGAGAIRIDHVTAQELEIEMGAGKLDIKKLETLKKTDIEGGAGEVNINNANLTNLDLDTGVGEFTYNGRLNGKTEVDAGVGELIFNLADAKENYKIHAETGIGSINIDGESIKDDFTYGTGLNEIDIDGGVGSIKVRFNA